MLLIQEIHIGFFKPLLRFGGLAVGPQFVGMIGAFRNAPAGFSGHLQFVGALHANVILFHLLHLPVDSARHGNAGNGLDGMGQLGRRLWLVHFFKKQPFIGSSVERVGRKN